MNKIITLDNGIRISFINIPNIHSVSFGCFFGAGSRFESKKNNGISHFIEHMSFKGTKKRTAFDLVCDVDKLGANMNAYTGKEVTCYYIQGLSEQSEACFEILADLVCNHTFPEDEMEKEKEVVVEEIKMCNDTPDDLCIDLAIASFWGDDPIGMTILGDEDTVRGFTRQDLIDYENQRYVASNLVISIAGNIDEGFAVDLVKKYFGNFRVGNAPSIKNNLSKVAPSVNLAIKPNEQANICLTYDGVSSKDPDENTVSILCSCFGGNMSSVLFQRLREELSLAYSVYLFPSKYRDKGTISIYIGTSPTKVKTALEEIKRIIGDYVEHGFSKEEFTRGVNQQKSAYLMGLESSLTLMRVYANYTLINNAPYDIDKELEQINRITVDDLNRVFRKFFMGLPAIGYVGTSQDFDLQEIFKGE